MSTAVYNSYPIFEPNQVLTDTQLNQLRDYLDEQTRLSRIKLIGMGIVCGLDVSFEANSDTGIGDTIIISKGTGITSQGFLISICECETKYYRPYTLPLGVEYDAFIGADGEQLPLFELLGELSDPVDEEEKPLSDFETEETGESWENYVVLMFIECFDKDLKSCLTKSCDEIGINRLLTLRKLLISKANLEIVLNTTDNKGGAMHSEKFDLPNISMPRVFFDCAKPNSKNYVDFSKNYVNSFNDNNLDSGDDVFVRLFEDSGAGTAQGTLQDTYDIFRPILEPIYGTNNPFDSAIIAALRAHFIGNPSPTLGIQYFYDFIKDMILAYNEFRDAAFDLMSKCTCCNDMSLFEKHLMLGEVIATGECKPSKYRQLFVQTPIFNGQADLLKRITSLHQRMVIMLENFDEGLLDTGDTLASIKITPSCEKKPALSKRSIPYYYHIDEGTGDDFGSLEAVWNYEVTRRCPTPGDAFILSYHNHNKSLPGPITKPLEYDLDPFSFLRIEGHLNMDFHKVEDQLNKLRKDFDLAFNVVALRLDDNPVPDLSNIFIDYHCGFEDIHEEYFMFRNKVINTLENLIVALKIFDKEDGDGNVLTESRDRKVETVTTFATEMMAVEKIADISPILLMEAAVDEAAKKEADNFVGKIVKLLEEFIFLLPPCISDFDIKKFTAKYKEGFQLLIDTGLIDNSSVTDVLCLVNQAQDVIDIKIDEKKLDVTIAFLYNIIDSFFYAKLTRLNYSFVRRTYLIKRQYIFCNYIEEHPGLRHLAGVEPGGTFIIVYDGDDDPKALTYEKVIADFSLPYICCDCGDMPICDDKEIMQNLAICPIARPELAITEKNTPVSICVSDSDHLYADSDLIEVVLGTGVGSKEGGTIEIFSRFDKAVKVDDAIKWEEVLEAPEAKKIEEAKRILISIDKLEEAKQVEDIKDLAVSDIIAECIVYTPPADFVGIDTFEYTITNTCNSLSDSAQVTVVVTETNIPDSITLSHDMIKENEPIGTFIGSLTATGGYGSPSAQYTFSLVDEDDGGYPDNSRFYINNDELRTNETFDFEPPLKTYRILIRVEDEACASYEQEFVVTVEDVNEPQKIENQTFDVDENSGVGTPVGKLQIVDDPDADAGDHLSFTIIGGNTDNAFSIVDPTTGDITVNNQNALNYEVKHFYYLTVRVEDTDEIGNPDFVDTAIITIRINNVEEYPLIVDQTFFIRENSPMLAPASPDPVLAWDPDAEETLTFNIVGLNTGAFTVHPSTGQILVNDPTQLDIETNTQFEFDVEVTDSTGRSGTARMTVKLINENEVPWVVGTTPSPLTIDENSAPGTVVGTVNAEDPEDTPLELTYEFIGPVNKHAFEIGFNTGEITVLDQAQLDFETTPVFDLTVLVIDTGGLAVAHKITINLNNVAPSIVIGQVFELPENSLVDTAVSPGPVEASDPAGGPLHYEFVSGGSIAFATTSKEYLEEELIAREYLEVDSAKLALAIAPSTGAFKIDAVTGLITVAKSDLLDFETTPIFTLFVRVSDPAGLSDTQSITINLINVAPSIAVGQVFEIAENSKKGTNVSPGVVKAFDPAGGLLKYRFSSKKKLEMKSATKQFKALESAELLVAIDSNSGAEYVVDPDFATFMMNIDTGQIAVFDGSKLDYEQISSYALDVTVTDPELLLDTEEVIINVLDQNELPIILDQAMEVAENATEGSVVGSVVATDPDKGDALTYGIESIEPPPKDSDALPAFRFPTPSDIKNSKLKLLGNELLVNNPDLIDFESVKEFKVTVIAKDLAGLSATAVVTIRVTNIVEMVDIKLSNNTILENLKIGTEVGALIALRDDGTSENATMSLVSGTGDTNNDKFSVVASETGGFLLKTAALINYEDTQTLDIRVRAMERSGLSIEKSLRVVVEDAIESFLLDELSGPGTEVGTLKIADPEDSALKYSIVNSSITGAFMIDPDSGVLTVDNSEAVLISNSPITVTMEARRESEAIITESVDPDSSLLEGSIPEGMVATSAEPAYYRGKVEVYIIQSEAKLDWTATELNYFDKTDLVALADSRNLVVSGTLKEDYVLALEADIQNVDGGITQEEVARLGDKGIIKVLENDTTYTTPKEELVLKDSKALLGSLYQSVGK